MAAFIKNIAIEDATGKQINHEIALNHKIAIGEYIFDGTADLDVPDTALGGNRELTMAEYQALSEEEKMNGLTYYITDVSIEGKMPVIIMTKEEYDALGDDKLSDGNLYLISDDIGDWTATGVAYDNTKSGLVATNVSDAIDELALGVASADSADKDGNGNIITETYETKTDSLLKLAESKTYTDGKIDSIIGEGASETLDTIGEISKAFEEHKEVTEAINAAIGTKQDASTAINTSNIGNQSVKYATSAGNADTATNATNHIANKSNPHGVTAAQIGLGNVNNTADSAKSVNYANSAGSANAVAWGNVSGKPSTFTPSGHSQDATTITASKRHSLITTGTFVSGSDNLENELIRYGNAIVGKASKSHTHSEYLPINGGLMTSGGQLSGDGDLWSKHWGGGAWLSTIVNNKQDKIGVLPIANGGTGANNVEGVIQNLFNNAISTPGYIMTFPGSGWKAGYSSMAQIRTALGISSSRHVKENICNISEEEANKLLDVNIVSFDYKENFNNGEKNNFGVIAEDVLNIIPFVVNIPENYDEDSFDESKGIDQPILSVDYSKFVPYLIKMVQIQQNQINNLEERLAKLENK